MVVNGLTFEQSKYAPMYYESPCKRLALLEPWYERECWQSEHKDLGVRVQGDTAEQAVQALVKACRELIAELESALRGYEEPNGPRHKQ